MTQPISLPTPETPREETYLITAASCSTCSGLSLDVPLVMSDWSSVRAHFAQAFDGAEVGMPDRPQNYSDESSNLQRGKDDYTCAVQVELLGPPQGSLGQWVCQYAALTPNDYGSVYLGESDLLPSAEEARTSALCRLISNACIDQDDPEAKAASTRELVTRIKQAFAQEQGTDGPLQVYFSEGPYHYGVIVEQLGTNSRRCPAPRTT